MTLPFIYALIDPRTNKVRYVGMSRRDKRRPYKHLKNAYDGKQSHLCNWIRELFSNEREPQVEMLERCAAGTSRVDLGLRESYHIQRLREAGHPLINHTSGGDGGWQHDEETVARIRAARARQQMPAYTEERRQKLSASLKGHGVSQETRAKLSATFAKIRAAKPPKVKAPRKKPKSHPQTPETRAKISEARQGIQFSEETRVKMSASARARRRGTPSPETREKIRESVRKAHQRSKEAL